MDINLKYFLENTIVNSNSIKSRITHPITGTRYPARTAFILLKKYADDFLSSGHEPRFISLAGLRGVGKTTLLWQVAEHISGIKPKHKIYFFNVNTLKTLGIDLFTALEEFQRHILHKRFNELDEPIILLFDEVHDDDNWSKTLKILYDEARTAFIMCTGSSALLLNQTADLARRMRIEKIFPFKFTEFILAKTSVEHLKKGIYPEKGLSSLLKETLFYSENIDIVKKKLEVCSAQVESYYSKIESLGYKTVNLRQGYINYQNIPNFLFFNEKFAINDSILDLFKRVILEDIPKINPEYSDYLRIEKLILRLAGSDEINPDKLSKTIGIKSSEINELVDILAKAELINVLLPFGNLDTRVVKNKKAFFMSPSLRRAMLSSIYGRELPEQFNSKLMEDTIVMYLRRILPESMIAYTTGEISNPDFVIETRDKAIILEAGSGKSTAKQIKNSKISYRYGILVSNGIEEPKVIDDILYLPFNWFLLL